MSKLYFKVASDWQEVVRLRNEIAKLETQIKSMDANKAPQAVAVLNHQMQQTKQQMQGMITEAAKAGAAMDNDFKSKIYQSSQSVNDFTQKIINQKAVVKDVEADVRKLGESYRSALKNNPLSASGKLSEYTSAKRTLDEEKAALFGLTQEQANARLSVKKLRDEYSLYKDEGKGVANTTDNIGISLKKAFAIIGGAAAIKQLGSEIIRVRGEFQSMQTAIETLVGKDMAGNLIPQIKELAKVSPLTLSDMVGAEKMMLGFNIKAEDTIRYLQALGDISMGNSQKFNSLTLAFSQMSATGKLMGQDLNQMINAGFNPLQQIADTTGKSIATLKDEMSKGAISTEMVQKAFIDATSAGGKFFGMSENASKTINGQLSMMQDAMDEVFNEIGTKGEGAIMSGIQATTSLIQNYETVGKILSGLVVTYGVYRTAVMLSTIATGKHTIAEVALTNVRVVARRAQIALNASMLTNPYVLLATVVIGLGAAMWAFYDGTTAAEKAQDSYNKKVEDAAQKAQDHKQKLEGLISEIQNEVTAETRKMEILDEIKKGYPSLFQKFIDEKGHIKDLTEAWKAYNEEASKNKAIQNKGNVSDAKKNLQEYRKTVSLWDKYGEDPNFHKNELSAEEADLATKYSNETLGRLKEKIESGEKELALYEKDVREDSFNQWKVDLKGKTNEQIKAIREAMVSRSKSAKGDKNLLSALGKRIIALDDESNSRNPVDETQDKSYWEKQKKDAQSKLDALTDIEASGKKGVSLKNQITEYDKKISAFSASKTASQESKEESAAEKLRKEQEKLALLLDKQALDQARSAEDLQTQVNEARINAMKDGSKKTIAKMELNFEKEMQVIDRQKEDSLRKKIEDERAAFESDPKNKKKTFDPTGIVLSDDENKQYDDLYKAKIAEKEKEEKAYLDSLLDEYQGYTDKRLAIETKFNNDLAVLEEQRKQAVKNGYTQQVEQIDRAKVQAEKNKKEDLSGVSLEEFKADIDWTTLFGNLDVLSPELLNKLRDKLKAFIETAADKLKPEDLKVLSEAMTNVDLTIADKTPYEALKSGLSGYKTATEDAVIAQEKLNKLQKNGKDGTKEYEDVTKQLTNAQMKRQESLKTMTQSVNSIGNKGMEVVNAGNQIVGMLENFGVAVPEAVGKTLDGIGQTMSALESIDITKPFSAVTGAIGVLTGIGNTIAGLFGFSGANYDDYNELKAKYEELNKTWDELIDKKTEYLEISTTEERKRTEQEILDLINKQEHAARNLGLERLNSGASVGSSSIGVRIRKGMSDEGWSQWDNFANSIGMLPDDIGGRLEGLFSLTNKQLENLKDNAPDFWAKLDDDVRAYLEDIIKCGEQTEETIKKTEELWAGMSFDSMVDQFKSALSDMGSSTEDFADDFQQYMINAMIDSFINGEVFQKKLKDWHKKLAEYSESDKKITKGEKDDLQKEWDAIVKEGIDYRDNLFESMGFSNSKSTSQNSTKGMSQSMNQDTGNELNGRFTALQISGEEIKNQSALQSQSLNLLTFKADAILIVNTEVRNIADETRTLIANSYLELQEIRENTGAIVKPIIQMQKDMAEVKRNTAGLAT